MSYVFNMLASTGIAGLDELLDGGLPAHHLYLIEGDPGAGKTTLALQFLLEGKRRGEGVLYITLSETADELRLSAESHGWNVAKEDIFELKAAQQTALGNDVSLFHPGEIELGEAMKTLLDEVTRRDPQRVVFDSLSEIRLLAHQPLRYRRQILALKQHFADKKCTVLLLDDRTGDADDKQVMSIAHGAIALDLALPTYGTDRRHIRVAKLRGRRYRGGRHDYVIATGGLKVFPRLVAPTVKAANKVECVTSGNHEFDALLGCGLQRGTSTLVLGPPGSGKSSLVATFAAAVAARGERAVTYLFDENEGTYIARTEAFGFPIRKYIDEGLVVLRPIDPAELSPGEFVHWVRDDVRNGARFIAIDSLNGYLNAMPEEQFLVIQLHELLTHLAHAGTLSFLVAPQHGFIGPLEANIDVSYLADTVVLMRYFEAAGVVRNALSVVKQRTGLHEKTIREFTLGKGGLCVGAPLGEFRGILTGVPEYTGAQRDLMTPEKRHA